MVYSGDMNRDIFVFLYPVVVLFGFFAVALVGEIAALFFRKSPRVRITLAGISFVCFLYGLSYFLTLVPDKPGMSNEGVMIIGGLRGVVLSLTALNVIFAANSIRGERSSL